MFTKRMNLEKRKTMKEAKNKTKKLANYFDFLAMVRSKQDEKGFEIFGVANEPEFKSWVAVSIKNKPPFVVVYSDKTVVKDSTSRKAALDLGLIWLFRKYQSWQYRQNGGPAQFDQLITEVKEEQASGTV